MNHQLFENLITAEEPLPAIEKAELEEHLRSCQSCQQFFASWKTTKERFLNVQMVSPRDGFTSRWQAHLAANQVRRHRQQSMWLLAIYLTGAAVVFFLLGIYALPLLYSPEPIFLAFALRITNLVSTMDIFFDFVTILLETINRVVPVTLWIGISVAMFSLSSLWVIAFRRLSTAWRIA